MRILKLHTLFVCVIVLIAGCVELASDGSVRDVMATPLATVVAEDGSTPPSTAATLPSLAEQASPTPTAFPTPAPVSPKTLTSCPVSVPRQSPSPGERYDIAEHGYANPQETMFVALWPEGKVTFNPGGPGTIAPDGSLGMKFGFSGTVPGDVTVTGRRLDAPAPPITPITLRGNEDGYGETGFQPLGLIFPITGCWEVTANVADERLTFVTLVVKVPSGP